MDSPCVPPELIAGRGHARAPTALVGRGPFMHARTRGTYTPMARGLWRGIAGSASHARELPYPVGPEPEKEPRAAGRWIFLSLILGAMVSFFLSSVSLLLAIYRCVILTNMAS